MRTRSDHGESSQIQSQSSIRQVSRIGQRRMNIEPEDKEATSTIDMYHNKFSNDYGVI